MMKNITNKERQIQFDNAPELHTAPEFRIYRDGQLDMRFEYKKRSLSAIKALGRGLGHVATETGAILNDVFEALDEARGLHNPRTNP